MQDLFSEETKKRAPLAERMRPQSLADFVGQEHIVSNNSLLARAIKIDDVGSCIFYGPPGTGKTTLAGIIANSTKGYFVKLNAVTSGVADAKQVILDAESRLKLYGQRTYLLLDECHRWNKAQSDCVLEAIEKGTIIFIGSTTENPYVSMTNAIVSRCRVFEFKPLKSIDILKAINIAINSEKGLKNMPLIVTEEAKMHFATISCGDLRTALNGLELAVLTTALNEKGEILINLSVAEESIQRPALSMGDDMYYDVLSAFCKSMRGSDANAALYYAFRLINAGCDPKIIVRRMIAHASEDIGMADSYAITMAINAMLALEKMGPPEAFIPISHAIIYICNAPKSNSVVVALNAVMEDVNMHKDDDIPAYLKVAHSNNRDETKKYKYPHNYGGYVEQQYLPNSLKNKEYYKPKNIGKDKSYIPPNK
ncbi:MAG: replication-associated recombination protein A [Clostridia bacterium]|jgi:putative ATPase|nr:replication-associated recombination protein A [Clostridia bacterium]MDD4275473.1 replication-associated recombination protein A [Clostridia bacterium]